MCAKQQDVYSYHTFMYPFLWKGNDNKSEEIKNFQDFLRNERGYWKPYRSPLFESDFSKLTADGAAPEGESYEKLYQEAKLSYAVYQYFNDPARKAIYGNKVNEAERERNPEEYDKNTFEEDVENYVLDCEKLCAEMGASKTYRIKPPEGKGLERREEEFCLDINNITLRLYPVGVAILVYELENRRHRRLDAVKAINDYGRRVQLASMNPDPDDFFKLTADEITVCGICENFAEKVSAYWEKRKEKTHNPWEAGRNYISKTVWGLFQWKGQEKTAVSFDAKEKDALYIESSVDDRMFTLSLVSDPDLIPYGRVKYDGIGSIERDCAIADKKTITTRDLYEFTFIDPPGGLCCQNRLKMQEDLSDSVNLRWIEYGTFYGLTQYSMVCITGTHADVGGSVINPFLTIYKELVQLVLVQRAAIIMFAEKAARVSQKARNSEEKEKANVTRKIFALEREYVSFQNQLLLFEVTAQLQGIEIYELLQKKMEISDQESEMEKQLQNLLEISQVELGDKTNNILNVLTVYSFFFTGVQIIQQQIAAEDSMAWYYHFLFSVLGIIMTITSICCRKKLAGTASQKKGRDFLFWIALVFLLLVLILFALKFILEAGNWLSI